MRINSSDISTQGKSVLRIRVDRIGTAGDKDLWWVALAFDDESTKPEGMFTDREQALELAEQLSVTWSVRVVLTDAAG